MEPLLDGSELGLDRAPQLGEDEGHVGMGELVEREGRGERGGGERGREGREGWESGLGEERGEVKCGRKKGEMEWVNKWNRAEVEKNTSCYNSAPTDGT